jgi:hypothetical protein
MTIRYAVHHPDGTFAHAGITMCGNEHATNRPVVLTRTRTVWRAVAAGHDAGRRDYWRLVA